MAKEVPIELEGKVVEAKPNSFIVETVAGHRILATLGGRMRMHFIKIVPGDSVKLEVSPYDLSRGRITYRM